jgi:hypothetical protein
MHDKLRLDLLAGWGASRPRLGEIIHFEEYFVVSVHMSRRS